MPRRASLKTFLADSGHAAHEAALRGAGVANLVDLDGLSADDYTSLGLPPSAAAQLPRMLTEYNKAAVAEAAAEAAAEVEAQRLAALKIDDAPRRISGSFNTVWSKPAGVGESCWRQGSAADLDAASPAETCGACGKPIIGEPPLHALDAAWHMACFTCSYCGEPIGGESHVARDGAPSHRLCFQIATGQVCAVCGKGIKARFLEMDGQKFHMQCFGGEPMRERKAPEAYATTAVVLEQNFNEGPSEAVLKSEYIAGKQR